MNKSEQIREFVRSLFDQNHDFSNRSLNKEKFISHFETEESKKLPDDDRITWQKHQTLFLDQFKSTCREKKIDPSQYGYGKPKEKFVKSSFDVESTITPKPKSIRSTIPTAEKPTQLQSIEKQPPQTHTPLTDEESFKLNRIIFKMIGNMANSVKPKFTNFNDDELDQLAEAWSPLTKPYLEKFGGRLFTATFVTASVLSSRADAFRSEKQRDNQEPKNNTNPMNSVDFDKWSKQHDQ